MKTKAIVAGAIVLVVLVFLAMLLVVVRKPPDITIHHVKSVQSAYITTMTFEITNHTANTYSLRPYDVQVRNGNTWTKFQDIDNPRTYYSTVGPTGLVYCTVSVRNLPAKSVVRTSIQFQKVLRGLSGLFRRAQLKIKNPSMTAFDRKSSFFGKPTKVTSDEFVETEK